jgi:hypothetical protein
MVSSVLAPDDSTGEVVSPTESSQVSGVYFIEVPGSFTATHGPGKYVVVLEVNTTAVGGSGDPHVIDSYSRNVVVYEEDFNSLAVAGDAMALTLQSVSDVVDGVWGEPVADQLSVGSMGEAQSMLDVPVTTRATQDDILSDATPFPGALVDAAVSTRAQAGEDMGLTEAAREAMVDAVWDEPAGDHTASGSFGETVSSGEVSIPRVEQIWSLSKNPNTLKAVVALEINGTPIVLPVSARLAVTMRSSSGTSVFSLSGIVPNAQGYFEVSQVFSPTAGTVLASFVTITEAPGTYEGVAGLSIPDLT